MPSDPVLHDRRRALRQHGRGRTDTLATGGGDAGSLHTIAGQRDAPGSGSPVPRPGRTLDAPLQIGRHPSAVVVAQLRFDPLIADPRLVHEPGIEGDMPRQRGERRGRSVVGPCRARGRLAFDQDVKVAGGALPFAEACPRSRAERGLHVLGRQIIGRRVVRLEDAQGARRVGHHSPAENDLDPLRDRLEPRRPRVGLDVLAREVSHGRFLGEACEHVAGDADTDEHDKLRRGGRSSSLRG